MNKTLVLAALVLPLMGCSDAEDKLRGQFLEGCVQGGAPTPICACTFDKLQAKYPTEALQRLTQPGQAPSEKFMLDVLQFAQACQHE